MKIIKNIAFIVTILFFIVGCRSVSLQKSETAMIREVIVEKLRDTIIVLPPDRAWLSALLECDSMGNVLLKKLTNYQNGKRIIPPDIIIKDNMVTVTASIDSTAVYLQLKDKYTSIDNEKVQYVETIKEVNRLTQWQVFQLWLGRLALLLIIVYIGFKRIVK